jgi:hypothetical protein
MAKLRLLQSETTATLRERLERENLIDLRAFKRQHFTSAEALAQWLGTSPDSAERWLRGECRVPGWVVKAIQSSPAPDVVPGAGGRRAA